MKPKIIVFSGVGNTGKSFIIDKLEKTGRFIKYNETARQLFDVLEKDGIEAFQQAIFKKEKERLFELANYVGKKDVLVDRTFSDQLVYYYWNLINGKIKNDFKFEDVADYIKKSVEIYDKVILFTKPFKTSKMFEYYNNDKLTELMNTTIRTIYGNKVEEYENSYDYLKKKGEFL